MKIRCHKYSWRVLHHTAVTWSATYPLEHKLAIWNPIDPEHSDDVSWEHREKPKGKIIEEAYQEGAP